MKTPLAPKITITKLDGALRQLRVAISLWFQGGDDVAVHTLACASHQIIHDINVARGGQDLLFDSLIFRDEYRKEANQWLRADMNFFKHADKDPEGIIEFSPMKTELFLMASLKGLEEFGLKHDSTCGAYIVWFTIHHPEYLTDKGRERVTIDHRQQFAGLNQREFFELYKTASDRLTHIR
ncbi:MAG: hypothetical protein NTV80_14765 [Verrucomicrobia bacterium]|nr:hypothetical protein [Verrucomicrobiota bacterium]